MKKSVLPAAIVGGIILFLISIISWKTVYWGGVVVKNFKDEQAVERVMRENAHESGVYVMPNVKDSQEVSSKLPVIFTGINLEGKRPLPLVLVCSLVAKFIMAFLACWLLVHHETKMPYKKKLGFFLLIGVLVAIASKLSFFIKGYYNTSFAVYSMIAVLMQWFIAGLFMAKIIKHK